MYVCICLMAGIFGLINLSFISVLYASFENGTTESAACRFIIRSLFFSLPPFILFMIGVFNRQYF